MSTIRLDGMSKGFGNGRGIERLDITVDDGEFFVLLGPSGCGKTTALRCIAGLEEPDGGRILLGDRVVADAGRGLFVPPDKRDIGMVFQSYALWPHMTVNDNVAYPLRARRVGREAVGRAVVGALDRVGLAGYGERYPAELSGGQQQRVALARALAASPRLILFDEPLSNLDAQLRARLRQDLHLVHRETRHTAVYVTHDQTEALALADRVAIMKEGRIEQIGSPDAVFRAPRTRFVAEFVGYENRLAARVLSVDGDRAAVALPGVSAPLIARRTGPLEGGRTADLLIRASRIGLAAEPAAGRAEGQPGGSSNGLPVRVEDVSFLGDHHQFRLRTADDAILTANIPAERCTPGLLGAVGATLRAILPADDLVALDAAA
ncbi:iron(III) transport system ATP-binding protein [Azospirillum agricola]|uniref:ABC transporter ATP-binding protein n=1 Tax=Azospirillum agricola TaxID=1720247 RepID=UPI001AE44D3E|nr:ABC transporter ATP-binding protein [Azospirillum agricola]MBP2231921.1 iron(III) transport system ATP-binding protein [Azospirillum agricola]